MEMPENELLRRNIGYLLEFINLFIGVLATQHRLSKLELPRPGAEVLATEQEVMEELREPCTGSAPH